MAVAFSGTKGSSMASAATTKIPKAKANKGVTVKKSSTPTVDSSIVPGASKIGGLSNGNLLQQMGLQDQGIVQTNPGVQAKSTSTVAAPKTFADYLAMAQQMLGGASTTTPDLSSYDSQISATQGAGSAADAKIQAMYNQLKGSFDQAAPGIASQYQASGKQLAANSDQATAATNQASNAAVAQITAQLQKLGIGDAAKVAASNGTTIQGQTAGALANIAANKAATLNNNGTKADAALDYNRGMGQSAQLGGAEGRATNDENVQKQIASILAAKQTAAATASTSGPSISDYEALATKLQDADEANDPNTLANQFKAQELANDVNKTQASAASSKKASTQSILKSVLGNVSTGGKVDTAQMSSILKQLKKAGLL